MTAAHRMIAEDKGRFTHGAFYHTLYDRPLAEARKAVVDLVPEGSSVLDIACGTGELCFELALRKNCQVVGVDLSRRMIEFARKRNPSTQVRFEHGDAIDLAEVAPDTFDFTTILFLLHEVPRAQQVAVLNEALRMLHASRHQSHSVQYSGTGVVSWWCLRGRRKQLFQVEAFDIMTLYTAPKIVIPLIKSRKILMKLGGEVI
jgi:SAM-dependent methyltransferase